MILNCLEETRKSPKAAPKKATAQSKKQSEKKRDNLWMYETATKPQWKKKSAALAKAKFGPPPKKSVVVSKQPKPLPSIETSQPLTSKRDEPNSHTMNNSFKVLKHLAVVENWRHPTRGVAEDQVRTMMEIIPPYTPNIDDDTEDMVVKAPSVDTSKCLEGFIKNGELVKYKEICEFLNVAIDELKGIMKQIKEISNFKFLQNLQSQDPVELPVTLRTQKNKVKSPNNVKLFHVVEDENLTNKPGFKKKEVREDIVLHISEQDCRTARSFKEAFLEYKKSSSHYNCPNGEKPWHIVERISEMIIDQVTKDVAQELEAEILMKQIIELEFKE